MNNYNTSINYQCDTSILGNSIDVTIDSNNCDSEIRADVIVSEYDSIRIWGQVKSCKGHVISGALIKLVQVKQNCKEENLEGIAHTLSDCNGFYQFDLCSSNPNLCYKIIVSKANTGSEKIVNTNTINCDVCHKHNYNVCEPHYSHVQHTSPKLYKNCSNQSSTSSCMNSSCCSSQTKCQTKPCHITHNESNCCCDEYTFHDNNYKKHILSK